MADGSNLLQPGETLGTPVPAAAPQTNAGLLQPGETLGEPVPQGPQTMGEAVRAETMEAGKGFLKGAGQTVAGLSEMIHKIPGVGETLAPEAGVKGLEEITEPRGLAQKVGAGAETIAELLGGDEALEGLAKAAKIVDAAKKIPLVAETLKMAEKSKVLQGVISGGTKVAKAAGLGGVQGAVKGAAEGKAEEAGVAGAVGAGTGAAIGEAASPIAKFIGEKFGIGTTALEDITRGAKPGKRNYRFAEDFKTAAPLMDAENTTSPAQSVKDWADHTKTARERVWQGTVEPLVQKHGTFPLSGINIKNAITNSITPEMTKFDPAGALKMTQFANEFMPGQKFALQVQDAENTIEYLNARLAASGFWSKTPAEREALMKVDPDLASWKAARDAISNDLFDRLNLLEPGAGNALQTAKNQYGALRNVENEIRGQINVAGRQAPMSLAETIGAITGVATGDIRGVLAGSVPILTRAAATPERAIGRAVSKAVGKEPAVGKAAQATAGAVKEALPVAGAVMGEQVGKMITFESSDGHSHSIPIDQLDAARQVDPKLVITDVR